MEKFYQVTGEMGKPIFQYNITDFDKAMAVAKTSAVDQRKDAYILTATHCVVAPVPEATVTELK